jgi:hypothetical protein
LQRLEGVVPNSGFENGFRGGHSWLIILSQLPMSGDANCITEKVTLRGNVASGKMLLSDRRNSQSEEQHDEPEKQA